MKTPEAIPPRLLRIIDAGTNRIAEGLRFLEEIARMVLDDKELTGRLKTLRHELVRSDLSFQKQLLQGRDAADDVGASLDITADGQRDLPSSVVANSRRVQESLRVLEELGKIPGLPLSSEDFQQARFDVYTIEKTLLSRLLRQDKTKNISGLYVTVDISSLKGKNAAAFARRAINGGAKAIELRGSPVSARDFLSVAQSVQKICARHDVLFIIGARLDVALALDADGLHIGPDDLPVSTARRLLPIDRLLGVSVSTEAGAKSARTDGADYLFAPDPKSMRRFKTATGLPVLSAAQIKAASREIIERFKNGTDR